MEKKGIALRKIVAGSRERKGSAGTIEKWCKKGDKETEEVLKEQRQKERNRHL